MLLNKRPPMQLLHVLLLAWLFLDSFRRKTELIRLTCLFKALVSQPKELGFGLTPSTQNLTADNLSIRVICDNT